jgi:hypothetical protein
LYDLYVSDAFDRLKAAAKEIDVDVDPAELRKVIDGLEARFCRLLHLARERGDHLLTGQSPVSWASQNCHLSHSSASDRLCVGEELGALPWITEAVSSGEIGYQAASVICHLSHELGQKRDQIEAETWVGYARQFSVRELCYLAYTARHAWDPEGFEKSAEEDYEQRFLHISELGRMYRLDAMLDPEVGAALKTAISALAKPSGEGDRRLPRQRRADALGALVHHALEEGRLPRRNGVRPHITVTTTLEGLKGELGAAASELEHGMPISSKTVQRLACDGTLARVLKADSLATDVGRATRAVSPATRRALRVRDKHCRWAGCDQPSSWSSPHHIEFVGRGGPTRLPNLVLLCHYHHRLVHEGGWQVLRTDDGFRFVPPDRFVTRRVRGPGARWAT